MDRDQRVVNIATQLPNTSRQSGKMHLKIFSGLLKWPPGCKGHNYVCGTQHVQPL